jgi:hypothetical protein
VERSQLLLLSAMPRSGSTWILRFLNELWILKGADDYVAIRSQYHLDKYMTVGSALIELSFPRFLPVLRPLFGGHSFTVKTHGCPTGQTMGSLSDWSLRYLDGSQRLLSIYLYRDPRDVVLSGYEYGRRSIERGKPNAFAKTFETIEIGIHWVDHYMHTCYPYWRRAVNTLQVRYEDILSGFEAQSERILDHLGLDKHSQEVQVLLEKYQPGATPQVGTHFFKGEVGRFRQELLPEQLNLFEQHFAPYLDEMGYS